MSPPTRYAVRLVTAAAAAGAVLVTAGCGSGESAADRVTAHPSWWTSGSAAASASPITPVATPSATSSGPVPTISTSAPTIRPPASTSPPTSASPTTSPTAPGRAAAATLKIVSDYISFSATRKAETAAYDKRHYGVSTWHLRPTVIVLHFTGSSTVAAARNTFASNSTNHGELPGTCAHYVIGQDGTVHAIVPTDIVCRHAIGLDDVAIGIEMAQSTIHNSGHLSDEQILNRPAQIGAALALVRKLQQQYSISSSNVIGHAMANQAPQFRDLEHWRNSHIDWQAQDVATFRSRLAKLA